VGIEGVDGGYAGTLGGPLWIMKMSWMFVN